MRTLLPILLASLTLATATPWAVAAPGDVQKVQSYLVRPSDAPDPDAVGITNMVRDLGSGEEKLFVQIAQVDKTAPYGLFVEDMLGSGDFQFVAMLESLTYRVDTADGDELPLGAMSLDDLVGKRLRIDSAGQTVLEGYFPCALDLTNERLRTFGALVRPEGGPDANARGRVAMRSIPGKGVNDFGVSADRVDITKVHHLYIEDGAGEFEFVGELEGSIEEKDFDGNITWKANTKKPGDELPLEVDSVESLLGRRIEIRVGGENVLEATLPGQFGGNGAPQVAEVDLERPSPAPDDNAYGWARMRIQPGNGGERFELWLRKIDTRKVVELWVEDPVDSDTLVFSDTLGTGCDDDDDGYDDDDDDDGQHEGKCPDPIEGRLVFIRQMSKGQALPLGVAKNEDLVGRRIEIRAGGEVILVGVVPSFEMADMPRFRGKTDLTPMDGSLLPGAKGRLTVSSNPKKGDGRFELKVKKLGQAGASYDVVLLDDAGDGPGGLAGDLELAGSGKGEYRRRTLDGDMLPLEVFDVLDLGGLRVQIRDSEGEVLFEGVVPAPEDG